MSPSAPRRVGIFGGSFNPPHVAHLALAEAARDGFGLDRVRWIPAATPPHKQDAEMPSAEHRLAMTRLAVEGHDAFEVSDLEVARSGVSYTADTVRVLQEDEPDAELFLLLGGDSLAQFASWSRPEEILERASLLVYPRPGSDRSAVPDWVMARTSLMDRPLLDLSSTAVRRLMAAGRSVRYLVPDAVRAYAAEHGLYRT